MSLDQQSEPAASSNHEFSGTQPWARLFPYCGKDAIQPPYPMHKSLRPTTNLVLIAVTASVAIAAMLLSSPSRMFHMVGAGALFGTILGFLQVRGISAAIEPLLAAGTAPQVRQAMMTSKAGRASIRGIWVFTFLLVVLASVIKGTSPLGIVAGCAAQMFFRDLITLKGCHLLQRRWEANKVVEAP